MANDADKRSASEKIEDLEQAAMSQFHTSNNIQRDLMMVKDALKLMANKVTSMMQASVKGEPLTPEVVSKYMTENNIEELKGKVQMLINQGVLVPADTVGDGTFLVGSENEKDGKVVHPRIQFTFGSLPDKEVQEKLKGAKVGDIVTIKEDKLRFVVKEIYTIVAPKVPETEEEAEGAPAAPVTTFVPEAPAAPAAEQSSSSATPAAPAADQSGQGSGN